MKKVPVTSYGIIQSIIILTFMITENVNADVMIQESSSSAMAAATTITTQKIAELSDSSLTISTTDGAKSRQLVSRNLVTLQPSSSPTKFYTWCSDSQERFDIDSIDWIRGRKDCDWADDPRKWFRCTISEVKDSCPVLCDYCNCVNNLESFYVEGIGMRTCNWPERKDTWWRCNNYPEVKYNCPLTCGSCHETTSPVESSSGTPSVRPSSMPSAQPSEDP